MIALVDYDLGNIRSVSNAFAAINVDVKLASSNQDFSSVDAIVLPGVGAFGDGMKKLNELDLVDPIRRSVLEEGKPFLGICLGMQLLVDKGYEHGETEGLGLINGQCKVMSVQDSDPSLRVPHIGWNNVTVHQPDGLYAGLEDEPCFYFVHSYIVIPEDHSVVSGTTNHSNDFAASIEKDNICATQFHPEKSHLSGIKLIKNWCEKYKLC
jgi:imidazole glycerol-phosphate synthase subunit HisH